MKKKNKKGKHHPYLHRKDTECTGSLRRLIVSQILEKTLSHYQQELHGKHWVQSDQTKVFLFFFRLEILKLFFVLVGCFYSISTIFFFKFNTKTLSVIGIFTYNVELIYIIILGCKWRKDPMRCEFHGLHQYPLGHPPSFLGNLREINIEWKLSV